MRVNWMRAMTLGVTAAALLSGCASTPPQPPPLGGTPANIVASVSDRARPPADVARDAAMRPGPLLAFAGVRPGYKVVDLIPAAGYFTRLLSKAVGPNGKVYAYVPDELTRQAARDPAVAQVTRDPNYANTMLTVRNVSDFVLPERVDLIFNGQHYHDMKSPILGPVDMRRFNTAAFNALKPGGTYVVVDYVGATGSGAKDAANLGRVDPAMVVAEVTAVGFTYSGELTILRDPADPHTARGQEGVAGRGDQFVFRFRRPR
jgi:predicted methyltransferase